ncbi:hypothetical protein [Methylocapsa acidiphila]|uniref:hypothetical protein n=1 Tax=Methylocapsa acidiphila TaxID=133552 RepID=UPI0003FAA0BD|nr:hypothetical protein [Methylocapsa acidiphila]
MTQQDAASNTATRSNGAHDLLSRLYREIGISAVAAALESTRKPQKPAQVQTQPLPAILRDDEAA